MAKSFPLPKGAKGGEKNEEKQTSEASSDPSKASTPENLSTTFGIAKE